MVEIIILHNAAAIVLATNHGNALLWLKARPWLNDAVCNPPVGIDNVAYLAN